MEGCCCYYMFQTDISRPLEFPTTPDMILDYHRQKPILNNNEEWLVVELNEYECLVDGFEILRIIAKHSKFFEVRPAHPSRRRQIVMIVMRRCSVQ